jgi:hypothetical protein
MMVHLASRAPKTALTIAIATAVFGYPPPSAHSGEDAYAPRQYYEAPPVTVYASCHHRQCRRRDRRRCA